METKVREDVVAAIRTLIGWTDDLDLTSSILFSREDSGYSVIAPRITLRFQLVETKLVPVKHGGQARSSSATRCVVRLGATSHEIQEALHRDHQEWAEDMKKRREEVNAIARTAVMPKVQTEPPK